MLEDVLRYCYGNRPYNWPIARGGLHIGKFKIENGKANLPLLNGQYFRIIGSVFNDGVYKYEEYLKLTDEEFEGAVWALIVPRSLIGLAEEIEAWEKKNSEAATGVYQSESFGGYSYTKATDPKTGGALTWESVFASRLNAWRKI